MLVIKMSQHQEYLIEMEFHATLKKLMELVGIQQLKPKEIELLESFVSGPLTVIHGIYILVKLSVYIFISSLILFPNIILATKRCVEKTQQKIWELSSIQAYVGTTS